MTALLTIGDFSRMTYLSVKALRHYHDIGLLEPADVDASTGYRLYRPDQVATAQVIRRFRDLGMPLDHVKAVLDAPDVASRNQAIVAHLERMERQLEDTQATVASLRTLLEQRAPAISPLQVSFRSMSEVTAVAIQERVSMDDSVQWWMSAFTELHRVVRRDGLERTGPDGALWFNDFFEAESGDVVAFVPVRDGARGAGRVQDYVVPAAELAVTVHDGPFEDIDQTYGALGTWVAENAIAVEGPIREYYLPTGDMDDLVAHVTEVCWPVFQTTLKGSG